MSSMSDSSMVWNPRIEEPSKPRPSSKMSSLSSDTGMEKCCQRPGMSMNRRSMILTPFSFAIFNTSFGVILLPPCRLSAGWGKPRAGGASVAPPATNHKCFARGPSSGPRLS